MFTIDIKSWNMPRTKRTPRLVRRRLLNIYIQHLLWQQQNRLSILSSVSQLMGHLSPQMTHHYVNSWSSQAEQIQSHIDPELMRETWDLAARYLLHDMYNFLHQQFLKFPCIDGNFYRQRKTSLQLRELIREPFPELASSEQPDLFADPKAWSDQTRYFMRELLRLDKASERIMEHVLQEDLGL
jgi:hypothetical protein